MLLMKFQFLLSNNPINFNNNYYILDFVYLIYIAIICLIRHAMNDSSSEITTFRVKIK